MRCIDVLHDGPSVPSRSVPVGLALDGIAAHFQVSPVRVEDPWALVGRDGNGAVHECGAVGRCDGINQGRAPLTVWSVDGRPNRSLFGAPAEMLLIVSSQFHVGCAVMFVGGGVEGGGDPHVKHGFLSYAHLYQPIDVDG